MNDIAQTIACVNLEFDKINTGFTAILCVYDMLNIYGIKYRKILNPNEINIE